MSESHAAGAPGGTSADAGALDGASEPPGAAGEGWVRRRHRLWRHSLRWRLVSVFLLLALATSGVFLLGMQFALGLGWREAARPLLTDYVDRVVGEIGSPPDVERARALAERLPVTIRITGPTVQWDSHPAVFRHADRYPDRPEEARLRVRSTADGHRIELGLDLSIWRDRPRVLGWMTLAALLAVTGLAYLYVRRLLAPLPDIGSGARRFGQGRFDTPIVVRRTDELGDLAQDVNAMASNIHRMLEAKRALLLAISHELRSPLTRARLHTELLPEDGPGAVQREALLRDLGEMRDLVSDLLESERLGQGHAALQREPTDLAVLVDDVIGALPEGGSRVQVSVEPGLPAAVVDRTRLRLLLRNLLDNARRHGEPGAGAVTLTLVRAGSAGFRLSVRDHGPGVDPSALQHLAEPFYRPDAARTREGGGVGLGLYLCRLVAQAHGGRLEIANVQPGLEVSAFLPLG